MAINKTPKQKLRVTLTAVADFDLDELGLVDSWIDQIIEQAEITEKKIEVINE